MNKLFIYICYLYIHTCLGQTTSLESIFSAQIYNITSSRNSTIFNDSIIYSVGSFENEMAIANTTISSNYSRGFYILKTTTNNDFVWLKKIADNQMNVTHEPTVSIDVDANENIIVGIGFIDKLYFSTDSIIVNDNEFNNGLGILKFDHDVNLLWSKKIVSAELGTNGIKIDNNNDLLVVGTKNHNFFLTKYGVQGDSIWTKEGGGSNSNIPYSGELVVVDEQNNYYCTGKLVTSNSATFDQENLVYPALDLGKYGSFLAKYNSDGTIQWLKGLYASSENIAQTTLINSIDVRDGNVIIGGMFNSIFLRSSPNEGSINSNNTSGEGRGYLIKYSTTGNRILGKLSTANNVRHLQLVENGKFYVSSTFNGQLTIMGETLSGGSAGNILVEKHTTDGFTEDFFTIGGQYAEIQKGFFKIGNIFFLIGATNSTPFVFNGTEHYLTTHPSFYIIKLNDNTLSLDKNKVTSFSFFPNPSNENVTVNSKTSLKNKEVVIYNNFGKILQNQTLLNDYQNEITLPENQGIYIISIDNYTYKIVKH